MSKLLVDIERESYEEGFKEGIKEGIKIGRRKALLEMAERMIRYGYDVDLVSEYAELEPEAVAGLQRKPNSS